MLDNLEAQHIAVQRRMFQAACPSVAVSPAAVAAVLVLVMAAEREVGVGSVT